MDNAQKVIVPAAAEATSASTDEDSLTVGPGGRRRTVTITLGSGPRFVDAHEIGGSFDFNVVTRPFQNNDTQRWVMTDAGAGLVTFMQTSSGRFLDAHEILSLDFRVVTRPLQDNATQLWRLIGFGGGFFMIQQVSSGRVLEAYLDSAKDFRVVTRPEGGSDNQIWRIGAP